MQPILDFGVRLIVAFQGLGGWLETPMKLFSFLGTEDFFMIVLPVLYWCVDSTLGMQVAVILMLSSTLNDAVKMALHGPRPYWISAQVKALATETSFGVPSGHTQGATVVWGIIAAWLRKWWAWLAAALLVLLIGASRLYLGVHFPHDVLLGLLLGILVLWLVLRFWKPVVAWARKKSLGGQILAGFLGSLALIVLSLIPYFWLKLTGWQPPQEWAAFAGGAFSLQGVATYAGTFFGLMVGVAWLARQGGFQTGGPWWQLVLRYAVGVAGVLIIRYGLKFIFPEGDRVLALFLRYIRYTVIGFWVSGAAPWVFVRARLAKKAG
jgi:membrane-associated phospholipid phosphatase